MTSAHARRLPALAAALAVLSLSWLTVAPAQAETPLHLPAQVVDPAGAITDTQRTEVEKTVARLANDHEIAYWVVYVNDFGGLTPEQWTEQTVATSDFGTRDVILAIATKEGKAHLEAPFEIDGLSDAEIASITADTLDPAVAEGDFAAAALDVGTRLDADAEAETASRTGLIAGIVIAVLLVAGGIVYYLRRRRGDSEEETFTLDELGQQPLDELDPWSREVLIGADRAIATSADELALAVDELGAQAAQPFIEAVLDARAALAEAFTLRQRIDDGLVTDPVEHRALLVQIITTCSDADSSLDGQVAAFDSLRDLLADADARFDALSDRIADLSERIPHSQAALDDLVDEYGPAVDAIAENVELAREHLEFADDVTAQGREAAATGAAGNGSVVGAIRSAEGALDQAAKLLDAVDGADPTSSDDVDLPSVIDRVQAASDYVHTRRGVVGSIARTRLSEARRLADQAADLAESGEPGSVEAAARASILADQALTAARRDVAEWLDAQQPSDDGYGDLAPVLTGILVDSVLDAHVHEGGYSHDGRSPASYGGSSSSGRIGVGGRI